MVRLIRNNEMIRNADTNPTYNPCYDMNSQTVRFSMIIVHLYRMLLDKEEESSIAVDMFFVLEVVGLLVGKNFYMISLPEIVAMIKTALEYNVTPALPADL